MLRSYKSAVCGACFGALLDGVCVHATITAALDCWKEAVFRSVARIGCMTGARLSILHRPHDRGEDTKRVVTGDKRQ